VVNMASYAPLFAHAEGWQWTPDLIWVNNLQSYGTPDYYVQKLYSLNKGTTVVPITMNNDVIAGQDSLYASACIHKKTNDVIIKIVNTSPKEQVNTITWDGAKKFLSRGTLTVLRGNPDDMNSFDYPEHVSPQETMIDVKGKNITLTAAPYSFNVIRIKML
jgi:alpha-L-arabinofuranosidase